jgi:hypothetical protein
MPWPTCATILTGFGEEERYSEGKFEIALDGKYGEEFIDVPSLKLCYKI